MNTGRKLGWIFFAIVLALISFMAGGVIGVFYGGINHRIDLCSDETSGDYIADDRAREIVCGR